MFKLAKPLSLVVLIYETPLTIIVILQLLNGLSSLSVNKTVYFPLPINESELFALIFVNFKLTGFNTTIFEEDSL